MIPDNVLQNGLFHTTDHRSQMEKSFITVGCFRTLVGRQLRSKLDRQQRSIHHLVFCCSRMYIPSAENYFSCCRIKVLVFQLSDFSSINRIGKFTTELCYIKMIGSGTNLFIRRKTNPNLAMLDLRMFLQISHG